MSSNAYEQWKAERSNEDRNQHRLDAWKLQRRFAKRRPALAAMVESMVKKYESKLSECRERRRGLQKEMVTAAHFPRGNETGLSAPDGLATCVEC